MTATFGGKLGTGGIPAPRLSPAVPGRLEMERASGPDSIENRLLFPPTPIGAALFVLDMGSVFVSSSNPATAARSRCFLTIVYKMMEPKVIKTIEPAMTPEIIFALSLISCTTAVVLGVGAVNVSVELPIGVWFGGSKTGEEVGAGEEVGEMAAVGVLAKSVATFPPIVVVDSVGLIVVGFPLSAVGVGVGALGVVFSA